MMQNILPKLSNGKQPFMTWSVAQVSIWLIWLQPSRFYIHITQSCQFLPSFKGCFICIIILFHTWQHLLFLIFQMNKSLKWQQICRPLWLIFWPKTAFHHINPGVWKSNKNGPAGLFEAGRAVTSEDLNLMECDTVPTLDSWWRHYAPLKRQ